MTLALFIESLQTHPLFFFSVVFTVVLSICVHELSHGWMAMRLGDRTPLLSGHMTLNPVVHMGPFSIVMLLLMGIAWGQMPIDPSRVRGKYGEAKVAFAGPASNLVMAAITLTILGLWLRHDIHSMTIAPEASETGEAPFWDNFRLFLTIFGSTNLLLCVFNLLPVPPLDGSHIMANFHRGYAQFIWNPSNQGATMVLFIVVASGAMQLAPMIYGWGDRYVGWVAGIPSY
jgi:Zn-dependent protease